MKAGAYTMGPRRVAIEYYVTPNATLGDKGIVTSFLPATTQNPTDDLVIRRWLGGTLSANAEWLKAGRARVVKVAIVPTNSTTTTTEREFPRTEEGTAQAFKWIRRLLETFSDRDKEELRGWKRQTTSVSSYLSSPRPAYYRVAGDERGSKIFRDQLKAQKGILTPLPPPEESSKKKEWINSRYEYF